MLKSKKIKSRLLTVVIAIVLTFAQMITAFADDLPSETDEIPVQTEPAMWLGDRYGKWKTVVNGPGEDSEIYVYEKLHEGYRAYHTIGYALFLGKEGCSWRDFAGKYIDTTIKPLFYFPTEGDDGEFKVDGRTYTSRKYINLEEVGKMFERKNPDINPYTRRLFLSPIVTYRYYASIGTKAEYKPDNYEDYADLVMQIKRDDNDIYTLEDVLEEIDHFYTCHATQFDAIAKKVGGNTWSQMGRPNAVFYTDLVGHLGFEDVTIDGEAVFAPYNKCKITSLSRNNQGKNIQSFAPGQTIPIIEPEEIEPEGPSPSDPGPLPILTYTSFPANNADGKSGDPISDSAIAINGEYYFANKAEQPEYDWSEKGGGYIPVTENITAYVKADNWIGSSQFAQCHDMAVFRVYFEIKYTKVRHTTRNGQRHTSYETKTHRMYVDVPRDVYYWKLYSFSGYRLTNVTLVNGSYPDKTISFDFNPPMSEKHTYYNWATSKYITNNVDWTGIGRSAVVKIDVTGTSNRKKEGIAKAYATAGNYIGYPTAWNDAFSITTDTRTLTYLTDEKVKMSRSKNRTESPKHYTEWDQDYISDQDTVTIPPTVANGYYGTTIQRTYTKFAEFNAREMDALTYYPDKDTKSSNASLKLFTKSLRFVRLCVCL